jgi:RNA polymerase sigma factor (sigma-70 family)
MMSAVEILDGPGGKHDNVPPGQADGDADGALAALYGEHYCALVRLASLLVGDAATAEKVVQDSFVCLRASRRRLRDREGALSYLCQSVLSRSRAAARRRMASERKAPRPAADGPAPQRRPPAAAGLPAVIPALRGLPARQREAVVMRYYAGLPEPRVAELTGISRRAVRRHTRRAMAALCAALGPPGGEC